MKIVPIDPDESLIELLSCFALPTSDINQSGSIYFFGCHQKGKLIGSVGIEICKKIGDASLFGNTRRSPKHRAGTSISGARRTECITHGAQCHLSFNHNGD
ncbi:hypothetical protein [Marinobacter salinexigens]|jgi:hypothetical protein|uniref:hypothetical protein n=1 Tax=Marinobacter salinexigens TaxID=2919747 RepID=UPI001FEB23D4|nr:hypothetical protein [Marinobacter salinexigens]|tara:strand:+ start:583 stop:885 length:303 start_codon:yes stop_codon:yes gene_type:complete